MKERTPGGVGGGKGEEGVLLVWPQNDAVLWVDFLKKIYFLF
jgi:hypothetical protein